MKKNILLVQSLLLLPLITPVSILSMHQLITKTPTPSSKSQKRRQKKLIALQDSNQKKEESSISDEANSAIRQQMKNLETNFDERMDIILNKTTEIKADSDKEITVAFDEDMQIIFDLLRNVERDEFDIADAKKELFSAVHYAIKNNRDILKERKIIHAPAEHQDGLKNVLNDLVNNPTPLKTPEALEVCQASPIDCWVEKHEAFQGVLHQLLNTEVNLKTPTFENSDLNQSVLVAEIPTKKGLTGSLYAKSFVKPQHTLIYDALLDGSFDPQNETHTELLEFALKFYVEEKNTDHILSILDICQHYNGQIELSSLTARKVHGYLTKKNSETQATLKQTLENKGEQFTTRRNALIVALQEETSRRISMLNEELNYYLEDCKNTTSQEGDQLRAFKKATTIIHAIDPRLKLAKNEYCSDEEQYQTSKNKTYITQADVASVYSNERILRKIAIDEPMAALQANTQNLLKQLSSINKKTQEIEITKQLRPALPMPDMSIKQLTM